MNSHESTWFCVFIWFKVEQYLMLSEFENNINADLSSMEKRRDRRIAEDVAWSKWIIRDDKFELNPIKKRRNEFKRLNE